MIQTYFQYRSYQRNPTDVLSCILNCETFPEQPQPFVSREKSQPICIKRLHQCFSCPEKTVQNLKKCAACQQAIYCSEGCQSEDWPRHKMSCFTLQKKRDPFHLRGAILFLPSLEILFLSQEWGKIQYDIEKLIIHESIHPNYIYLQDLKSVERILLTQNWNTELEKTENFHFLSFLLRMETLPVTPLLPFLQLLRDFSFVVHAKHYARLERFHPLLFDSFQFLNDLYYCPLTDFVTEKQAVASVQFASWVIQKKKNLKLNQLLTLPFVCKLASLAFRSYPIIRCLSWILRTEEFKSSAIFAYCSLTSPLPSLCNVQQGLTKTLEITEYQHRQRQSALQDLLNNSFFQNESRIVLICMDYLEKDVEYYFETDWNL